LVMEWRERVSQNLSRVLERVERACARAGRDPRSVEVMAVTKGFPPEAVLGAFEAGLRLFGENRVQEAQRKFDSLPREVRSQISLHMIGHLQSNKVKRALEVFDLIQTIDRTSLVEELCRRIPEGVSFPAMVEVKTSPEPTKGGVAPEHLLELVEKVISCGKLRLVGLMTVAPLAGEAEARRSFSGLRAMAEELRREFGLSLELSMGMSDDLEIAVEEGSTLLRLGRALFGPRP